VIGANSILIYLAGRLIDFGRPVDFFLSGLLGHLSEQAGAVVFWLGFLATERVFLWVLYRRRIFLKV